ncbi:flagellar biosynthetic protein FliR [bacterium]|nr:flagellar biosynthetic protein FliR [bacterium]
MTTFLMAEIIDIFYQFLFPFSRLSAFLLASPFYSIESINVRFRIAISAVFTFLYLSYLEGVSIDPLTSVGFLYILQEIAIGVILGFSLQLVSAAITVGGQAISNAMGLGMANMFDPNLGNVPVISQFLIILSTLIFLLIDGHLVIIDLIFQSFEELPIGQPLLILPLLDSLLELTPLVFSGGLLLALPMMISLLLVNIGLGIITRSAPSLNIIAVGFPAILLIGSILLIVALPGVLRLIQDFWIESFEKMTLMIGI